MKHLGKINVLKRTKVPLFKICINIINSNFMPELVPFFFPISISFVASLEISKQVARSQFFFFFLFFFSFHIFQYSYFKKMVQLLMTTIGQAPKKCPSFGKLQPSKFPLVSNNLFIRHFINHVWSFGPRNTERKYKAKSLKCVLPNISLFWSLQLWSPVNFSRISLR